MSPKSFLTRYFVIGVCVCLVAVVAIGMTRGGKVVAIKGENQSASGRVTSQGAQAGSPPVQVIVTKMVPQPGRYVYRYTVVNGSAFPITDLLIGKDQELGIDEVAYPPMGSSGDSVPPSSFMSPPGWRFRSLRVEEDSIGYLKWDILRSGEEILGGTSVGGFEVTTDEVDQAYESGHWTVYLNSSEEPIYTGGLQQGGVTAVPMSSVFAKSDLRVSPNPATGQVGIAFDVSVAGPTTVDVFDARGRLVRRVYSRKLNTGSASVSWDGLNETGNRVAAGVYFVRVKTPGAVRFGRVTFMK